MAQARAQGTSGFTAVHVWMVGFVFLWLTSTVLLVWLYTEQEDLKNTSDQLRQENQRLVRGGDKGLTWYTEAQATGSSMARLCEDARMQTAVIAVGEEVADVEGVHTKVEVFFNEIKDDGLVEDVALLETAQLLPAMTMLYQEFKDQYTRRREAEDRADGAERELRELATTQQEVQSQFDSATDGLKGQIATIEQERSAHNAERDQEIDDFGSRIDDMRQAHSREVQSKTNEIQKERRQNSELQSRYAELQTKLGELQIKPGEQLSARMEDGRVVRAEPGDGVVYIDLGRRDHLTPGLQFAVYPSSGIPADGRAKARVEVTRIHEGVAECKILAVLCEDVVIEGDLVANPVYDPARLLRFVVVGNFDLDGNGRDDPRGDDHIKGLISGWGGEVVEVLSSRVDFVVAGFAPPVPKTVGSAKTARDRDVEERERLLQRRAEEYEQVLASAASLSIPILTQDVFLQFLGF